jgi:hypothetical protein
VFADSKAERERQGEEEKGRQGEGETV